MNELRWIDCKQELPTVTITSQFFGLATDGRTVFTAWYFLRRWDSLHDIKEFMWTYNLGDDRNLTEFITHWMPLPAPPDDKDAIIGQLRKELGECYILSGADPDKDADEPWRLAPYAVREVKRLREESDEEMEQQAETIRQLQKELDLHKRALTHEQTMCNEQAETMGQLREELSLIKADLSDLQDGCDRGHAELVKQAETIRQMTGLLREYESSHDHLRQKCSICIKAGELLKEDK